MCKKNPAHISSFHVSIFGGVITKTVTEQIGAGRWKLVTEIGSLLINYLKPINWYLYFKMNRSVIVFPECNPSNAMQQSMYTDYK